MNREQAVNFMTTIAGDHLIEVPAADDGTDVDLDALVGACAERFNLQRERLPLELWNWAIDAAAPPPSVNLIESWKADTPKGNSALTPRCRI